LGPDVGSRVARSGSVDSELFVTFDPTYLRPEQARPAAGDDPRFSFHEVAIRAKGLWSCSAARTRSGSCSAENLYGKGFSFEKPRRSLLSLAAELGDQLVAGSTLSGAGTVARRNHRERCEPSLIPPPSLRRPSLALVDRPGATCGGNP
jgi:hypothetical protein